MKKINGDNLKKMQIEILDVVDEFCRKNDIKYWLESGTLIGAVRHNGFIPWDDDIDIGMLRSDYDKFLKTFNNYSDNYKVYSIENNKKFYFPFAKVLKIGTQLFEPNKKYGYELMVNIDLFVFDNSPLDSNKIKFMMKKRNFLNRLRTDVIFNDYFISKYLSNSFSLKNKFKIIFLKIVRLIPASFLTKKMVSNSKKYVSKNTELVGNFLGYYEFVFPRKCVEKVVLHKFENRKYPIPVGYDELLRIEYGDYMKLPPIEKRKSHHEFEAFIIDKK